MEKILRFIIQNRKGVKNMKKMMTILPIFALVGIFAATSAFAVSSTVSVSASVTQGTATLAIMNATTGGASVTSMGFASLTATAGSSRAKSTLVNGSAGSAYVQYFSGGGTYELRTWFDNYVGNNVATADPRGLLTTVSATNYYWPLKIWYANFGPAGVDPVTGPVPNPNTDSIWKGAAANYKWLLERAYKVDGFGLNALTGYPAGGYKTDTRTTLTYYYPAGTSLPAGLTNDARMASGFLVALGIDALDAQYVAGSATTYSGTMTFDLTQTP